MNLYKGLAGYLFHALLTCLLHADCDVLKPSIEVVPVLSLKVNPVPVDVYACSATCTVAVMACTFLVFSALSAGYEVSLGFRTRHA